MSDSKRPNDDEKVDINNFNDDDLDKTKVFNINSRNNSSPDEGYVSKHSLSSDEYGDDFSGEDGEISSYSQSDKSNYKDDYTVDQVEDEPRPIVSRTDTYGNQSKKNNSKKPIVIGLIVAALVLVIVAVIIALNSCSKNKSDDTSTSTTETSTTVATSTTEYSYSSEEYTSEYTTEPTTEESTEPTTQETTEEETTTEQQTTTAGDSSGVNASFAPYKCITPDGDVISDDFAKELKGDVSLSLKSNGKYTLKVGNIANESGNYEIDGNAITLGSYDGNIMFDNAGNPVGVTVYVDDYTVSFN